MERAVMRHCKWAIVLIFVVLVYVSASREAVPFPAQFGGRYVGKMPGFGAVSVDFFDQPLWGLDSNPDDKEMWVYHDGKGDPESISIKQIGNDYFGEAVEVDSTDDSFVTNATMRFYFSTSGAVAHGLIGKGTNTPTLPFELKREFSNLSVKQTSKAAKRSFYGQVPLLPDDSAFRRALKQRMVELMAAEAQTFTTGDLQLYWERLRGFGFAGSGLQEWQTRLLNESVASFAVRNYRDYGSSCGNLTSWESRTYSWRNNQLCELRLADFFQANSAWEVEIRSFCHSELIRRKLELSALNILNPVVRLDIFTLSPTGIQIYINPYEIASGAEGEFIFHIPYERLKKFYKTDWPTSLLPITQLQ